MDPIKHLNPIEQNLCNKADLAQIPIAGNIELLPLCNMDCKMCFAKMTKQEMEAHAPMRTYSEWLEITEQASRAGCVFMLLTGGEPFLYPDFDKLYYGLKRQGYIVSVNSNGTLITEKTAEWLAKDPPRRMNITLYGASDETYAKLCGNPRGFTQVMNGVGHLIRCGISVKFNCSLTPYNIDDFDQIWYISKSLNIPIEVGYYMFPPVRSNNIGNEQYRLSPEAAAGARYHLEELRYGEAFDEFIRYSLDQYRNARQTRTYQKGYTCRSGNSVYWINYDGTMSACSFTNDCQVDVFRDGFDSAWNQIKEHVADSCMSKICHQCEKHILCGRCAAAALSETGTIEGVPEYYCRLTEYYIELLKKREEELNED